MMLFLQIHIGGDVWMHSNRWSAICNEPKHSMFVKNMMVAIWGTSTLKGKSLEGKICPRFKGDRAAKPPLTPTKVSVMKGKTFCHFTMIIPVLQTFFSFPI